MKKRVTEYHFDRLAALLLFGVFAICVVVVLLTGADAYKRLVRRDEAVYDRRTCMQYVSTRVRQAEESNKIKVEDFGGKNALVIADSLGCITRVYYCNGHIMELYTDADADLPPEAGEEIMEAGGLDFFLEDGLLTVIAIDTDGKKDMLRLSLYNGGRQEYEE